MSRDATPLDVIPRPDAARCARGTNKHLRRLGGNVTQHNSDPLPYVQVDRAVKPKAALLAGRLGCTVQHALGSLVEWWDLSGDPRALEAIVASTPPDQEPAVVLSQADAELRFELASGHHADAPVLVTLGLLEQLPDGYRVRGMSRYFAPVLSRMRARKAAAAGGRASAEARRTATGSAQPRSARRSESASGSAQADAEALPKRRRSDSRSGAEAGSKPSGQRTADSVQLQVEASAPKQPARPRPDEAANPQHQALVKALDDGFRHARGKPYPWRPRDFVAVKALRLTGQPLDVLAAAWARALKHVGYPTVSSPAELHDHLAHFVGAGPPAPAVTKRGPVPAEAVDWDEVEAGEVPL